MKQANPIQFEYKNGTWESRQDGRLLTIGDDTLMDARAALKLNYVIKRNGQAVPRRTSRAEELRTFWGAA